MVGVKHIKVYNKKVSYDFKIRRKITIISGDSGTGKTTLVDLIEKANNGEGVYLECECKCGVLVDKNWQYDLSLYTNSILFIDENFDAINTKEFADAVNKSDNYFVIINREKLSNLAFSYKEIYTIKSSGKFNRLEHKYKESTSKVDISWVLVEDSKSGFEFFKTLCNKYKSVCSSAMGKSNLKKSIAQIQRTYIGGILVVCDGSAIGSEINQLDLISKNSNIHLIMNESFEFMLLNLDMFKRNKHIMDILKDPYNHISSSYISHESFYTELLSQETADTKAHYGKSKLNRCYIENCCFRENTCIYYCNTDKISDLQNKFFSHVNFLPLDRRDIIVNEQTLEANYITKLLGKH